MGGKYQLLADEIQDERMANRPLSEIAHLSAEKKGRIVEIFGAYVKC